MSMVETVAQAAEPCQTAEEATLQQPTESGTAASAAVYAASSSVAASSWTAPATAPQTTQAVSCISNGATGGFGLAAPHTPQPQVTHAQAQGSAACLPREPVVQCHQGLARAGSSLPVLLTNTSVASSMSAPTRVISPSPQRPQSASRVQYPSQVLPLRQSAQGRVAALPPQNFMPNRFAQMTPMASSVLRQIEQVVGNMERELEEDIKDPRVLTHSSDMIARGGRAAGAGELQGDQTLDWLDTSIEAMERWQKTCQQRRAKLEQLRQITEGHRGDLFAMESPGDGIHNERLATQAGELKARVQDMQKDMLTARREKKELERNLEAMERECQAALDRLREQERVVGQPGLRAQAAERSAAERVTIAEREVELWRKRLMEYGASATRDKGICEEAESALATAEAYLKPLEDNSRAVLEDCRALQRRVQELEHENSILALTKTSFDDERAELLRRAQLLTTQRAELEDSRNAVVDETHSQSVKHNELMQQKGIDAMQASAEITRQERRIKVQVSEVQAQLAAVEASKASIISAGEQQHARDMEKVQGLEQQIFILENESQAQEQAWRTRIQELEMDLAACRTSLQDAAVDKRQIEDLERELVDTRHEAEALSQRSRAEQTRARNLQAELDALSSRVTLSQEECNKAMATLGELEAQLKLAMERQQNQTHTSARSSMRLTELQVLIDREREGGQQVGQRMQADMLRVQELEEKIRVAEAELEASRRRKSQVRPPRDSVRADESAQLRALEDGIRESQRSEAYYRGLLSDAQQRLTMMTTRHEELLLVSQSTNGSSLRQELADTRAELEKMRRALQEAQSQEHTIQKQTQQTLSSLTAQMSQKEKEWGRQLEGFSSRHKELQRESDKLEDELRSAGRRSSSQVMLQDQLENQRQQDKSAAARRVSEYTTVTERRSLVAGSGNRSTSVASDLVAKRTDTGTWLVDPGAATALLEKL